LVEHRIVIPVVVGSSPIVHPNFVPWFMPCLVGAPSGATLATGR